MHSVSFLAAAALLALGCGADSSSSCGDTTSDPHNCGGCGHDCRGAACTKGICEPVVLATHLSNPRGIAVDDANVYFTDFEAPGSVAQVPKNGGAVTVLASGMNLTDAIAVSKTTVYWASYLMLASTPIGGGPVTLITPALPCGLASDADSLYFLGVDEASGDVTVGKLAFADGSITTLATGVSPYAAGIAVDDTNVYVGVLDAVGSGLVIEKVPKGGGPLDILAAPGQSVVQLAAGGGRVYWTSVEWVLSIAATGGPVAKVAGGQDQVSTAGVVVDSDSVYWTSSNSLFPGPDAVCSVCKAPLRGGPVTALAQGPDSAWGIAVDATSVYWTTQDLADVGSILKAPK